MAEVIGANDRAALTAVEDLPVLNVADLDADPHGMFRRYHAPHPFVGHETGAYLVLRHADIERIYSAASVKSNRPPGVIRCHRGTAV